MTSFTHLAELRDAAFSPDGHRVATASADYAARLWNAEDGSEIAVLKKKKVVAFRAA